MFYYWLIANNQNICLKARQLLRFILNRCGKDPTTRIRSYVRIAIFRKRHFRSPKWKNENTLLYKVPPKTWENSPQKPLLATRKWFFGHCYVQNVRFLKILQCPDFEFFLVIPDTFSIPKSLTEVMGDSFLSKNTLSSHVIWHWCFKTAIKCDPGKAGNKIKRRWILNSSSQFICWIDGFR